MTRPMYSPELESDLLRRLHADRDIGDVLRAMPSGPPASLGFAPDKATAENTAVPLELALVWLDSGIRLSLSVYVNEEQFPVTCDGVQGGRVFLSIPASLLRPGRNLLVYYIHFWTGGWRYRIWVRTQREQRELSLGSDSDPNHPAENMVRGEAEVEL